LPSGALIRENVAALKLHAPFSEMSGADVEFVASQARLQYFAAGEIVLEPGAELAPGCFVVRQGAVEGTMPDRAGGAVAPPLALGPGDFFPIAALMGARPPSTRYVASSDLFCWLLPREHFEALLARSAEFSDYCNRRMSALMELSMQVVQARYAAQNAQWRLMSQPLRTVVGRTPIGCAPDTPLAEALAVMEREGVGAMLVLNLPESRPLGIFTRQDVIGRIVLPKLPLSTPISSVMSHPVSTLPTSATVADAMMLMASRTIRHVPIVEGGIVVGMVTERDLFALQRRNLRQLSDAIIQAREPDQLVSVAGDIREWSRSLVAQGVAADHLTRLISKMNDLLAQRLVELLAQTASIRMSDFCWLAFGSEGREEQTIATDQDNGIVFDDTADNVLRSQLLQLGEAVNGWLDQCGYPLCKGGIMAGNPACCLSVSEWRARFERWVSQASPDDLLKASIFFDLRPLAGRLALGEQLRQQIGPMVQSSPRFQKLMSDNAQRSVPPRFLASGVLGVLRPESETVDLKLHGTMPMVDVARLLCLAHGITESSTAARLEALMSQGIVNQADGRSWIDAFNFLQALRLRAQHIGSRTPGGNDNPNRIELDSLSPLDRRILIESLRQVRKSQQRLALDYP